MSSDQAVGAIPGPENGSSEGARLRALRFKQWIEGKDIIEACVDLLPTLDVSRAERDDLLQELVLSLCGVEVLTGLDRKSDFSRYFDERPSRKGVRSIYNAWSSWMTRLRSFTYVPMRESEVEAASPALRASLTRSTDESGREQQVLETLRYTHGHAEEALTPDQKLLNRKFNAECHRLWTNARRELDARMDLLMEAEMRRLDSLPPDVPTPSDASAAYALLEKISIGRIRAWAEEDAAKDLSEQKKKLREIKYQQWIEGKELIDGGISLFLKIDETRVSSSELRREEREAFLRELTIALAALEVMIGVDRKSAHSMHFHMRRKKKGDRSIRDAWFKWMTRNYSFEEVKLHSKEVAGVTATLASMLRPGNDSDGYIIDSLQFNFPGHGKSMDYLTKDQKILNKKFVSECNRLWLACRHELDERVYEYVAREKIRPHLTNTNAAATSELAASASQPIPSDSALVQRCMLLLSLNRLKEWIEQDEDKAAQKQAKVDAKKAIERVSRLKKWVEHKDSLSIRMPRGKIPKGPSTRLNFAPDGLLEIRSRDVGAPQNTVDLLLHSGLKTVHAMATNDLEKSRNRLLEMGFVHVDNFHEKVPGNPKPSNPEKEKEAALVKYREEMRSNITIQDKKERRRISKLKKGRAYARWADMKQNRELALQYLSVAKLPVVDIASYDASKSGGALQASLINSDREGGAPSTKPPVAPPSLFPSKKTNGAGAVSGSSASAMRMSRTGGTSTAASGAGGKHYNKAQAFEEILNVGIALKKVDRALFSEWSRWCEPVLTPGVAGTLWDFFYPSACDLHNMVSSERKSAFLRVLRANPNFVEFLDYPYQFVFKSFVPETWKQRRKYISKQSSAMTEEEKKRYMFDAPLSRDDLSRMLLDMGMLLSATELKALADVFDPHDTGLVDMNEFLKFTWPLRETNAGTFDMLSKKCCWSTTCRRTGMPNGFVVTVMDATDFHYSKITASTSVKDLHSLDGEETNLSPKSSRNRLSTNASAASFGATTDNATSAPGATESGKDKHKTVYLLGNGSKKVISGVAERNRRENVLKKYGLLPLCGELETGVTSDCIRSISMLATIRRKLALNDYMRKRGEKISRDMDMTATSIRGLELSKVEPGSATINIAYEPLPPLSLNEHQVADERYDPQSLVDELAMYEGDMDGCAKIDDFDKWIADSGLNFLPHERKFIIKNFEARKSPENENDDPYQGYQEENLPQVDFKLFAAALGQREVIKVGDVVESKFRRRDRWFLAKVLRITNIESVAPETSIPSYDVQYVELGLDGVLRVPKHPVKRPNDADGGNNDGDIDQAYENTGELIPVTSEDSVRLKRRLKIYAKGCKDEVCDFVHWYATGEGTAEGLAFLASLTEEARAEDALRKRLASGKPPSGPMLWSVNPDEEDTTCEDGEVFDPSKSVLLRWRPGNASEFVAFYSIEFAGAAGCLGVELRYKEIFRDPPNASEAPMCRFQYKHLGLDPATSYLFRIRAVSGFGASEYTYLTATTRLAAPIYPQILRLTPVSVTLRWLFSSSSRHRLNQLRKLYFEGYEKLKNSSVYRDENLKALLKRDLAFILDNSLTSMPHLSKYLARAKERFGIQDYPWGEAKFLAVLDNLERDRDEVAWPELEKFMVTTGFVDYEDSSKVGVIKEGSRGFWRLPGKACGCGSQSGAGGNVRVSLSATGKRHSCSKFSGGGVIATNIYAAGGSANCCAAAAISCCENCGSDSTRNRITYVIEQLGPDGEYHDIFKTPFGEATINRLVAGEVYKFRIYGLNPDGSPGPRSEVIALQMPLDAPQPPCIAITPGPCGTIRSLITARSITLRWNEMATKFASKKDNNFVKKMMAEWSGVPIKSESTSIPLALLEKSFQDFDRNQDGCIDPSELGELLQSLGIIPTENKIRAAFERGDLDSDRNGNISFQEFYDWWMSDSVSYVLKRSTAIRDPRNASSMLHCVAAGAMRGASLTGASAALNVLAPGTLRRGGTLKWKGSRLEEWELDREPFWNATIGGRDALPLEYQRIRNREETAANSDPFLLIEGREDDGRDGEEAASIAGLDIEVKRDITTDVLCYWGKENQYEVKALTPNQMYVFKLRYVGARTSSYLSQPLMVMTAPLPCREPSIVWLQGSSARVKWYPPDYGAHTFEVQLQLATEHASDWVNVYNGPETTWTASSATLTPNTAYNLRVVGINAQGTYGEPSPVLSFLTPSRETNVEPLSRMNADYEFKIECIGDICVGDIILFNERLFRYDDGRVEITPHAACAPNAETGLSTVSVSGSIVKSKSRSARDVAAARVRMSQNTEVSAINREDGGETLRLDLGLTSSFRRLTPATATNASTASIASSSVASSGLGTAILQGAKGMAHFIGERTVAAHVLWDNYRSIREGMSEGAEPLNEKSFYKSRKLWLQVIWCRSSNEACREHDIKAGTVINRTQIHLEQYETFRLPWDQEGKRRSLQEELNLLASCYGKFGFYHHYQCEPGH